MSPEALSAGSHLFSTVLASFGVDVEELRSISLAEEGGTVDLVSYDENIERLTRLGDDAVGADPKPGQSPVEKAYEGSDPSFDVETDPSPIMQSARAVADAKGMSPGEREAFLQAVQDDRAQFTETAIPNGSTLIVGDGAKGGYNAKTFIIQLAEGKGTAFRGTYVNPDTGEEKEFFILKECSNPAVPAVDPEPPVPVAPPAAVCEPTTDVDQKFVEGNERNRFRDIEMGVITKTGIEPDKLWNDTDGDGKYWEEKPDGYCLDREELPGLPTEEEVEKDIEVYEAKYGHKPKHLVYSLVDCNGRSVVVCWNAQEDEFRILKDRSVDWNEIRDLGGNQGFSGPVIDSKEELDAYFKANPPRGR